MDAHTLVRDVMTLASLPGACVRVMALAGDPHATTQQIAEVIAHDPALAQAVLDTLAEDPQRRAEIETRLCGFTYADVGAALLEAWGLPASLVEPVRCHLRPGAATAFAGDAALLNIAREATMLVEPGIKTGARATRHEPTIAAPVWAQGQLVPDVLPAALDEVDAQWFAVIEILNPGGSLVY